MKESHALTTVSQWLRAETQRRFSLTEAPVVIHNFVDISRFNPEGRAGYPERGGEFHLLHASNLRPVKRIGDVVRVFDLVQRELPARLTILGEGPEKGLACELAAELGLSEKVRFTSTAKDVPAMMKSAHVKLLLSDYESFGLSALESLACGTPVAGYRSGGLPEVVAHGGTGLLGCVGDINGMALDIVSLLRDRDRWVKMSKRASAEASSRFSIERIIPEYEALYESVLRTEVDECGSPIGGMV